MNMWKPESYRDTDFGLAGDESFEPDDLDLDDREPGPGKPYIQTALGRIEPEDAGVTLMREHLHLDDGTDDPDQRMTSRDAALVDLETFFTVGGRTVVDATIPARARSATALTWLAQRAPVHIVAASGFHLDADTDASAMEDELKHDVSAGLDGTSARPGIVVISLDHSFDRSRIRSVFAMIADVLRSSPLPLLVDVTDTASPSGIVADGIDAGIPPRGIIVRNMAQLKGERAVAEIAELGTYLLFDGLGMRTDGTDRVTASRVAALLDDRSKDRLLLSHGFTRRSHLTGYEGKPGLAYIVEQFAILLLEAGVAARDVRTMLVENCVSALTIVPQKPISTS